MHLAALHVTVKINIYILLTCDFLPDNISDRVFDVCFFWDSRCIDDATISNSIFKS